MVLFLVLSVLILTGMLEGCTMIQKMEGEGRGGFGEQLEYV